MNAMQPAVPETRNLPMTLAMIIAAILAIGLAILWPAW